MFQCIQGMTLALTAIIFLAPAVRASLSDEAREVEIMERSREAQKEYFREIRDLKNQTGYSTWSLTELAAASCKYASQISLAPPAKTVVLTFDDGPTEDLTPEVLAILAKYQIKATFFLKGDHASIHPEVVKAIKTGGHTVGNHSWDHPDFHKLSETDQTNEVVTNDDLLKPFMTPLKLFRYPYGNSTCFTNNLVKQKLGYNGIIGWHVDTCDWAYAAGNGSVTPNQARICEVAPQNISNYVGHVLAEVKRMGGGVILMHDVHVNTVANLEKIIQALIQDGYKFANLDNPNWKKYFF